MRGLGSSRRAVGSTQAERTTFWKDSGSIGVGNLLEDTVERAQCPEVDCERPKGPARHNSEGLSGFLVTTLWGSAVHLSLAVNKETELGKLRFPFVEIKWHRY